MSNTIDFQVTMTMVPVPLPPERVPAYRAAWKAIFKLIDQKEQVNESRIISSSSCDLPDSLLLDCGAVGAVARG